MYVLVGYKSKTNTAHTPHTKSTGRLLIDRVYTEVTSVKGTSSAQSLSEAGAADTPAPAHEQKNEETKSTQEQAPH